MTKSTSERSSSVVLVTSRSRAAVASSFEIRCFDTSFSRSFSKLGQSTDAIDLWESPVPANFKPLSIEA